DQCAIEGHSDAPAQRCEPRGLTRATRQRARRQRFALGGGVVIGLEAPNHRSDLIVCSDLRTASESWFFDRRTAAAAGRRHAIYAETPPGVETEIEAAPIVMARNSGRELKAARIVSPVVLRGIAAIASAWIGADFLLDADEVAAPRAILRREHADA